MTDVYAVAQALNRIADALEDINQKLDYIIKKQTEEFFGYAK
jgi:hypothetical protein